MDSGEPEGSAFSLTPVHTDFVLVGTMELASQLELSLILFIDNEEQSCVELVSLLIVFDVVAHWCNFTGEVCQENLFVDLLLPEVVLKPGNKESRLLIQIDEVFVLILGQILSFDVELSVVSGKVVFLRNIDVILLVFLSS